MAKKLQNIKAINQMVDNYIKYDYLQDYKLN